MIRFCFLCVIIIAQVSGAHSYIGCTRIIPQTPVVELYTNLTFYCVLNQTCLLQKAGYTGSSSELYWQVSTQVIPESQYNVINESVSSVTFQPTPDLGNVLTCSIKLFGQLKSTLYGMIFSLGLPPDKPENLSCVCYNGDKLTCAWDPGRATYIPTTYTLKQSWRTEAQEDCETKEVNNSCTLYRPKFQLYIYTTFWVEAKNDLGSAKSNNITLDISHIIKPNPPVIQRVVSAVELQRALKIEWTNPMDAPLADMKYNLRYRMEDSTKWEEVNPNDISSHRTSFTLQDLQPYTKYVISLRCKQANDKGFWSEWSKESSAITPECEPSRAPELWRRINNMEPDGVRVVRLMWKDLQSYANGIIRGYNVTIMKAAKTIDSFLVTDRSCNITASNEALEVQVIAYNNYGSSPTSTLIIPSVTQKVAQFPEIDVKVFPKDGKLWVEWTAPKKAVLGYVIEWCGNSESIHCTGEWQREPSSVQGAFLRGDLKPYVYYLIKVYPLYRDGVERPGCTGTYLQQGPPKAGPTVQSKSVEKNRVVLVWNPIPLEKQNGFITNYTLKYSTTNGPEDNIFINVTQTEYTLSSLTANTVYRVSLTANTVEGGKEGPSFTFATKKFDTGEVEVIVVCSCFAFLITMLCGFLFVCHKRDLIKKHIWPNVPDPSKSNIAQWSPQTPTRHDSKSHPFQDGSFTDVSVVEITADEKKSYSEQDLKSVDLMKKNTSEGLSSGIGGSSCMSSPQLSVSDSDEVVSAQNTSSTVQYSTVIISAYRGQQPTVGILPIFSRSESTQPLLESEERPDEQPGLEISHPVIPNQYSKQNSTEECIGRLQTFQQENLPNHTQESSGQSELLTDLSHEKNLPDYNSGQNVNSEDQLTFPQVDIDETKSYLPQTGRRGGYMPQ